MGPLIVALGAAVLLSFAGTHAHASDDDARPTIQRRFAPKKQSVYLHATGTAHIRNDFYDSYGFGADIGYYPWEELGFELRGLFLQTRLSAPARDIQERTGLTPDARPQSMLATLGPRYSFGYGKILAFRSFVVHFDPQLAAGGGVALAETRWIPSGLVGLSLLLHFKWGIQAKFDINASIQGEKRDRGWVTSVGFMPVVGIGWNLGLGKRDE